MGLLQRQDCIFSSLQDIALGHSPVLPLSAKQIVIVCDFLLCLFVSSRGYFDFQSFKMFVFSSLNTVK